MEKVGLHCPSTNDPEICLSHSRMWDTVIVSKINIVWTVILRDKFACQAPGRLLSGPFVLSSPGPDEPVLELAESLQLLTDCDWVEDVESKGNRETFCLFGS